MSSSNLSTNESINREDTISSNTPSNATLSSNIDSLITSVESTPTPISSIDLENPKNRKPFKERIAELNEMVNDESNLFFDPECLKKRMGWSKSKKEYNLIDSLSSPNPELILNDLKDKSPKLYTLMKKIEELDASDLKNDGTLYKHMIFTDMKTSGYGLKNIASVLVAKGLTMGYKASPNPKYDMDTEDDQDEEDSKDENNKSPKKSNKPKKKVKEKKFNKIRMLGDDELLTNKYNNFYILSSVNIFDQPIDVSTKKQILTNFNSRPDNVNGEKSRFILMDSGFKEGIDLYDIKYIHIFEPQITLADKKQVIGRGTRTCGQKGLKFHPSKGWPLHVQIYDMSIPKEVQQHFGGMENTFDLYLKSLNLDLRLYNFVSEIEEATIKGSVDYDLNKNIHSFKINGGTKKTNSISLPDIETEVLNPALGFAMAEKLLQQQLRLEEKPELSHDDMRSYINKYFSEYKWPQAKMENLCKTQKGGSELLTYTPTQGFIKSYFTPQASAKGMLLWHSTGSGKTCSAIATATNEFEKQGYTILWVTRTTLKNDIWKNMFDMVCHEVLRAKISGEGLVIPSQQPKRMRLLSNSWRIRPMSYKQFSNLVSKKNNYYERLVKINGEHDPLRKTLIVIDEAHKLYGGGDLSTLERPDMDMLHKSLMHSYSVSGLDSVKLLLMTATPITTDPMEIIKLVNLCKPIEKQMPVHFDDFTKEYLNSKTIRFTPSGLKKYFDNISGIVSYLNREKDARQFAQPIIHSIQTPLVDMKDVYDYDLRILRNNARLDIAPFHKRIQVVMDMLKGELSDLDPNKFRSLEEICKQNPYVLENEKLAEQFNKKCLNVTRKHMRNISEGAKKQIKIVRNIIKELRTSIKEINDNKNINIDEIKTIMKNDPEKWKKFKESAYYNIRYKCGKTVKSNIPFDEMIKSHIDIIPYMEAIHDADEKISDLKNTLNVRIGAYKSRVSQLQDMIKYDDLTPLEKSVVRSTIKERRKLNSKIIRSIRNKTRKNIRTIEKERIKIVKNKKKTIKRIKRDIKEEIKKEKRLEREFNKNSKQMKKIMRKTGEYEDVINNDVLKQLVEREKVFLKNELDEVYSEFDTKIDKEKKKQDKERERDEKKREKEVEKLNKLREREEKKRAKEVEKLNKLREREEKKRAKEAEKTRKQREREEKKLNRTRKNK